MQNVDLHVDRDVQVDVDHVELHVQVDVDRDAVNHVHHVHHSARILV